MSRYSVINVGKKAIKRAIFLKLFLWIGIPVILILLVMFLLAAILVGGGADNSQKASNCKPGTSQTSPNTTQETSSGNSSIEEFVKEHEKAYLESWRVGGFLPSASIVQTQIETSFDQSVQSFGQAHNMGGVKWSKASDFAQTVALYGSSSVSKDGAGTSVGDDTGGKYVYFSTFDAGIVGKAEFMKNQTLYKGAINNTDGLSTLSAIADGGWATDPSYKSKLHSLYNSLGAKFKWLDEKAISQYGASPVSETTSSSGGDSDSDSSGSPSSPDSSKKKDCNGSGKTGTNGTNGDAVDGSGKVPEDATALLYTPDTLPSSLSPYLLDPRAFGMEYGGKGANWEHPDEFYLAGQCVNLTISFGNILWGHKGVVIGNGIDQAAAWA
ncbi:glucosaminidase domain-containing protein, partial [Streptococcus sp. DD11]